MTAGKAGSHAEGGGRQPAELWEAGGADHSREQAQAAQGPAVDSHQLRRPQAKYSASGKFTQFNHLLVERVEVLPERAMALYMLHRWCSL